MDAWKPETFPKKIHVALEDAAPIIHGYYNFIAEDRRMNSGDIYSQGCSKNPYVRDFQLLSERLLPELIKGTSARGWHYSRMTHMERLDIIKHGLQPTSICFLSRRLREIVNAGFITEYEASIILDSSVLHSQADIRLGQFWSTNIPYPASYLEVQPLLSQWGGEGVYWEVDENSPLGRKLFHVGEPTIVEVNIPLYEEMVILQMVDTIMESWAKRCGCPVTVSAKDICVSQNVTSIKVLNIHVEGEDSFSSLGVIYPEGIGLILGE